MESHSPTSRDTSRFASGVRTAVFVVVLGTVAAVTDHAFFIAPHGVSQASAANAAPLATPPNAGDALPPDLRPTTADVEPPPPTF
jgi:hypothetical protein